jgi:site-specific recombinase XerD
VGIQHGRGHALRHTVACRIVNQGGSIKEVADVLRHRSLNTSMIYAKVVSVRPTPSLRRLAELLSGR